MSNAQQVSIDQDQSGLLDRIASLVPEIAAAAPKAEEQGALCPDVFKKIEDTGVFRSLVPARFGGYEIDMDLYIDIGLTLGRACVSTAWNTLFLIEHNHLLTGYSEEFQQELFGSQPYVLMAGAVNPAGGTAEPVDGGYIVNGRWPFGSGIQQSSWAGVSCNLEPGNFATRRMFMIPKEEIAVLPTWEVSGMCATGSCDIVVENVFVPENRMTCPEPPKISYDLPILPLLSMAAGIPAVAAAQRALELFTERLSSRHVFGSNKMQSDQVPAQIRLANLTVENQMIELSLRNIGRLATAHGRGEHRLSLNEQQQLRLQMAHLVRRSRNVVRDVMESSGASVHYLKHDLQRFHRDIHVIAGHTVFDVDLQAQNIGKAMLDELHSQEATG